MDKKIKKALEFAWKAHKGVRRDDTTLPYFVHPYEVYKLLSQMTQDTDVLCAGILHDVIEDTKYTKADISRRFGKRVADIVLQVTKEKGVMTDRHGLMVKLADMLSNASTTNDEDWVERKVKLIQELFEEDQENKAWRKKLEKDFDFDHSGKWLKP